MVAPKASEDYIDHLESTIDSTLGGLRILVDCANGAASTTAARLFDRFSKLRTDVINADPDGININEKCGSTHIDGLAAMVKAGGYDIGIALMGTRTAVWRSMRWEISSTGDQIMAACGLDMKAKGKLPGNAIVATVMSNLGLHLYSKEKGMDLECTAVGDRNVLERMLEKGYRLGGEQSGPHDFPGVRNYWRRPVDCVTDVGPAEGEWKKGFGAVWMLSPFPTGAYQCSGHG